MRVLCSCTNKAPLSLKISWASGGRDIRAPWPRYDMAACELGLKTESSRCWPRNQSQSRNFFFLFALGQPVAYLLMLVLESVSPYCRKCVVWSIQRCWLPLKMASDIVISTGTAYKVRSCAIRYCTVSAAAGVIAILSAVLNNVWYVIPTAALELTRWW